MMKKLLVIGAVGLVALVFVASTQWISLRHYSRLRARVSKMDRSEVLIAAVWPFTINGDGFDEGLALAQEEVNARGGVLGKPIRIVLRDGEMDREESRTITRQLSADPRITAVIGYYDDMYAVRASAVYEEAKLLHIVTGASNTYMAMHGFRYLVRTVLSNDKIARSLAAMCIKRGLRNVAIVAEEGAFGEDLADQVARSLDAQGARVVYRSLYVRGLVDFRDEVNTLRGAGADAVLMLGFERESAWFIRAARTMGVKVPIVGSFSDTPLVHDIAGRYLDGVMFYDIYDIRDSSPQNQAFVASYRRRFHHDPTAYGAQGYDALSILVKAIETTHSFDSLDLAWAIRYMERWNGANGSYQFTPAGEIEDKDIVLKMYRGGNPTIVERGRSSAILTQAEEVEQIAPAEK